MLTIVCTIVRSSAEQAGGPFYLTSEEFEK